MDTPIDIDDITFLIHKTAIEKGWWPANKSERNIGEALALIHSEVSESLEAYRDGAGLADIYFGQNGKPEGFPVELADIIIRILDLCGGFSIPISQALALKVAYNTTRPFKHGGKAI